jgi:hypothetical protein
MVDEPTQEAQQQMAMAALQQATDKMVAIGHEDYGVDGFDAMASDFATAIGKDNIAAVTESILQCDAPQRVIEHLSGNSERAKAIAKMTPQRRAQELGRIESQIMPFGSGGGIDPAWIARAKNGNRPSFSDDASDEQWNRAFKLKYPNGFNPRNR